MVLVGNKCDLEKHRQVSTKTAEDTTEESMAGCKFFEASAKYDINVKEVFLELLQIARNLEEAQEALLEEQDLFRRKSRRLSKRLSRKLSCFNNMAFNLKKSSPTRGDALDAGPQKLTVPTAPTITTTAATSTTTATSRDMKDNNPKCVLI